MNSAKDTDQKYKLKEESLLSLLQEQWTQIRHLDALDFRNMTLLPIAISVIAIGVQFLNIDSDKNTSEHISLSLFAGIIIFGLSASGCYTTFRNWLCYMRRFSIITAIENQMHLEENGIIKKSIQFTPPQNHIEFIWSLIKSIRFPLVLFYAVLSGCGVILAHINPIFSIFLTLFVFAYCYLITYYSMRKEFSDHIKENKN